ncbi:MAG: triacylglycerol lipase [Lachnospiraceae bacterium]|nr:triacylglycerol lipase [Lachnospiraceae bacterium]
MKTLKSFKTVILDILAVAGVILAANSPLIITSLMPGRIIFVPAGWLIVIVMMISPDPLYPRVMSGRLKILRNGLNLLFVFCISSVILIPLVILMASGRTGFPGIMLSPVIWIVNFIIIAAALTLIFFAGMIRVYVSSEQLAIKWRIIGLICGLLPIINIVMLIKIISVVSAELDYENARLIKEESRRGENICKTRYPILLVHGVFFRDFRYLNYWGRIPDALEKNGAVLYYGEHQSAASVAECGRELAQRIESIVKETGCEKLNVIAHSKGGLDTRYAISKCGADKYVASLTTINTPHRGCEFADYLLGRIPAPQQQAIAAAYNGAFKKLGDEKPDFLEAVGDLTHEACTRFNDEVKDVPGVIYKSIGSKLNKSSGGRFPLNMSYHLVKYFDGDNDGLVGEGSFEWGSSYRYLKVKGNRGISHGDMIDLNRENIPDFDVREFYIDLVKEIKEMGL